MRTNWLRAFALMSLLLLLPFARAQAQSPVPEAQTVKKEAQRDLGAALDELKQLVLEQRRELEEQRLLLRRQQEQIEALERNSVTRLQPLQPASLKMAGSPQSTDDLKKLESQMKEIASSTGELQKQVGKLNSDLTAASRNAEGRFRQFGNFRFSGDLRLRYEPFIQAQQTTRQRVRFRGRLNLTGNISEEFYGGITFATGSLDDPISTNQTLTGFYNRKQVGFDRYFLQYTPKWLNQHAQFGVGKFAFPWIRTGLTFDTDLNPEGAYIRTNWDFKKSAFRGVTLVGVWLPFFERAGSTSPTTGQRADGLDGFIAGGQLQTRWKLGDRVNLGLHVAALNVANPDFIAQAHSTNPITANLAGVLQGNFPNTNSVRTNPAGLVVGYASRFLYLDTIAQLGVNTARARWPINLTLDFNNNVRATRIIQNNSASPTGQVDNPERSAFGLDLQFGRLAEHRDIQFGYSLFIIERDAVIGAFTESDKRAGSNIRQHRLNFSYQWLNNVSLNYVLWLGRLQNAQDSIALVPGGQRAIPGGACNAAPYDGCKENILKRMQFDLSYRF